MDKMQTYLIGVRGDGPAVSEMKHFSVCHIPEHDRWIHVGAAWFESSQWQFAECEFPGGVQKMPLQEYLETIKASKLTNVEVIAYPAPWIDTAKLKWYEGWKFSKNKYRSLFTGVVEGDVFDGITCGEYISLCSSIHPVDSIAHTRPVDFQMMVESQWIGEELKAETNGKHTR